MSPIHAPTPTLDAERAWHSDGYERVAGLDEAGRGAWAGPVVAAAVVLPSADAWLLERLAGVRDSKLMTPAARESALSDIVAVASAVRVGVVPAEEIDRVGVVPATRAAMLIALAQVDPAPHALLIDAVTLPTAIPQRAFPKADQLSLSVAAASVVAKVTRDRIMVHYDATHPGYGFAQHKGYGTAAHALALGRYGLAPLHRRSFAPIQAVQLRLLDEDDLLALASRDVGE